MTEDFDMYFGFHRLSIIDTHSLADQPFMFEDEERKVYVAGNEEIYNYKELTKEHDLPVRSGSDFEVILWLYIKYGIKKTIELVNGEFAFYIIDINKKDKTIKMHLARDQCGIRPLFWGRTE